MKNLFVFKNRSIKFFHMPWIEKLLLFETFLLTGVARLAVVLLPMNKLSVFMGKHMEESPLQSNEAVQSTIHKVEWAVGLVSPYTPWQSKCLVQALAAQSMLKRRRISSTLYLGVARDGENRLIAHAWLRSGPYILTGGLERKRFTVVAHFANGTGDEKK